MSRRGWVAIGLALALVGGLLGLLRLADGTDWPIVGSVVRARTVTNDFELVLISERQRYAAEQPIVVRAELTYIGPDDQITISGQRKLIAFGATRDDGLQFGILWDDVGGGFTLERGIPLERPLTLGYATTADDPFLETYRTFGRDPLHRLPAGTYELAAATEFRIGDDMAGGNALMPMEVSLRLEVQ